MQLICYPLLTVRSQRSLLRRRYYWGREQPYQPRPQLLKRLGRELNWSEKQVRAQLDKERKFLLKD